MIRRILTLVDVVWISLQSATTVWRIARANEEVRVDDVAALVESRWKGRRGRREG